jgi:hypothetical protein
VVVVLVNTIRRVIQRAVVLQVEAAPVADSLVAVMVDHQEQEQLDKVITVLPADTLGIQEAVVVQARQHHNQAMKLAMVAWVFLIVF